MTCPLCGQIDHRGPCYAELKREWMERDKEKLWKWTKPTMRYAVEVISDEAYAKIMDMEKAYHDRMAKIGEDYEREQGKNRSKMTQDESKATE